MIPTVPSTKDLAATIQAQIIAGLGVTLSRLLPKSFIAVLSKTIAAVAVIYYSGVVK